MTAAVRNQSDWSQIGDRAHFVQFYEDEAALVPLLSRYVGTALVSGDAAIVVVGRSIRERVAAHLWQQGYDLAVARTQDRYFDPDCAATLRQIVRGGSLDAIRFNRVVGRLLDRAAGGARRVAVFGDMVSLLWAQGQADAAIRLEELWNDLRQKRPFTLGCAYAMNQFSNARHAAPFVRICSQHSHVFSAAR